MRLLPLLVFAVTRHALLSSAELYPEEEFNVTIDSLPIFKTQPDFRPVLIKIINQTGDPSELEPGLLFVSPHIFHIGFGPHLFAQDGTLVWYGQPTVGRFDGHRAQAMDFAPCEYMGEKGTHFCYSEGRPKMRDLNPARRTGGLNRIFDNTYTQVGTNYVRSEGFDPPNPHEFTMTPGGKTYLHAIYHKTRYDLSPYEGRERGFVYEPCFQEVDVQTREQIFKWCYLDYHPIWQTDIFLRNPANIYNRSTRTGGRGSSMDPWDFAHLNAVDKNEEGDYLVSLRHFDQIVKIAGPNNVHGVEPGTTLWRLGGKGGTISLQDNNTLFSRQHHSRFQSTTKDETVISVFDNSFDGIYKTAYFSSAKTISINNVTNTSTLLKHFKHPFGRLAASQGSTTVLKNGNTFVGWGARPQFSEFSENGTLLYHAQILPHPGNMTNYRTFKAVWTGNPSESDLKLVAYCLSCVMFASTNATNPLWAYVSWNGATEVDSWRFHLSATSRSGPWFPAGTLPKDGFETKTKLWSSTLSRVASFVPYVSVEALNKEGVVIGRAISRTFVPDSHLTNQCDEEGCYLPERFLYTDDNSKSVSCQVSLGPMTAVLLLLCIAIEAFSYAQSIILHSISSPSWLPTSIFRRPGTSSNRMQRHQAEHFYDDHPEGSHEMGRVTNAKTENNKIPNS